MFSRLRNFAGSRDGSFFRVVPPYVDTKLAPGMSTIPTPLFSTWLSAAPFVLVDTPNTVWALIALAMYFGVPYDLSPGSAAASAPLSAAFFAQRAPLWLAITLGYTAFWHVAIYFVGAAQRPFIKNREYNVDKVLHNIFWSASGVAMWVAFENVFAYLWATGRLPYLSDAEAWATPAGAARFIAGLMLTPIWRDFHFYVRGVGRVGGG